MKRLRGRLTRFIGARGSQQRATFLAFALCLAITAAPALGLTINLDFAPDSTFLSAGLSSADIANMKAAANFAAAQFTNTLSDHVNVNIHVTAVSGTGTLGQSDTIITTVASYSSLRAAVSADSKTADDATALGAGGSLPNNDPINISRLHAEHSRSEGPRRDSGQSFERRHIHFWWWF